MVKLSKNPHEIRTFRPALRVAGTIIVLLGLLTSVFHSNWTPKTLEYLSGSAIGQTVALFVPYAPIALITIGAALIFSSVRRL